MEKNPGMFSSKTLTSQLNDGKHFYLAHIYLFNSPQGVLGQKGRVGGMGEKVGNLTTGYNDKSFVDH